MRSVTLPRRLRAAFMVRLTLYSLLLVSAAMTAPLMAQNETSPTSVAPAESRQVVPPVPRLPASVSGLAALTPGSGTPWHLLSVPDEPDSIDPAVLLTTVASNFELAYAYDNCDAVAPWKVFDPTDLAASDLDAIDHRIGFWLKAGDPDPLAVSGSEPAETAIQLCAGWNLIGYPLAQDRPVLAALSSIAGKFLRVYGFDPVATVGSSPEPWRVFDVDAPQWANTLQRMERARGYWVYATEDTTLVMRNVGPPPDVEILSPEYGATVTAPTDILGSVRSDLLDRWQLGYRVQGEGGPFTVFATSDTPVEADVLDRFDPTLLLNGLYEVQLSATDFQGFSTSTSTVFVVEGGLKIGHVRLDFLDLEVQFTHLPIKVFRSYDSRDRRSSDFGHGWRLSLSDVTVQENLIAGDGWRGVREGTPTIPIYCIESDLPRIVAVTFPSGELFRYRLNIEPRCQPFIPQLAVDVSYELLSGPTTASGSLDPLGFRSQQLLVVGSFPGPIQLFSLDTVLPFDPNAYQLSMRDGTVLDVDQDVGLTRIAEPNGREITFSPDSIVHSNGPEVSFDRDAQDRITRITGTGGEVLTYDYDANGDLVSFTNEEGNTFGFTYLGDHFLHEIIKPDGTRILAAEYDDDGRLIEACGEGDSCHQAIHDLDGNTETIIDATGVKTIFTYDSRGRVLSIENALGHAQTFEYDERGRQIRSVDQLDRETILTWQGDRLVAITRPHEVGQDPDDFTTRFGYDGFGQPTFLQFPGGGRFDWQRDAKGNVVGFDDIEGTLVDLGRDTQGRITSETNPFSTTSYSDFDAYDSPRRIEDQTSVMIADYDASGRTTRFDDGSVTYNYDYDNPRQVVISRPGDEVQTFDLDFSSALATWRSDDRVLFDNRRDAVGKVQTVTSNDDPVAISYDPAGRPVGISDRFEGYIREIDAAGRIQRITSTSGDTVELVYDAANQIRERRENGDQWQFDYWASGDMRSMIDPRNHTWRYDYTPTTTRTTDPLNRVTTVEVTPQGLLARVVFPDLSERAWTYALSNPLVDGNEYPATFTDEAGRVRSFGYDAVMNLTSVTDLAGEAYTYTYDQDFLKDVRDPSGRTLSQTFDDRERLRFITREDSGVEELRYEPEGFEVVEHVVPSGRRVALDYDGDGNVTSRSSSDGELETFAWEGFGVIESATNAEGTTRFVTGPSNGYLERIELPAGDTITYGRDPRGLVTSIEVVANGSVTSYRTVYGYDGVDNLTSVLDPLGGLTTIGYDEVNRPITRRLPNGVETSWEYDLRDRVRKVTHRAPDSSVITSSEYTRRLSGEPERIVYEDGSAVEFGYDLALRLEEERIFSPAGVLVETVSITYDKAGNRLTRTEGAGTDVYAYGNGHRLTSVTRGTTAKDLVVDPDGRVTQVRAGGVTRDYSYDFMDRLLTVTEDGQSLARYRYDARGRRIAVETSTAQRFLRAPTERGGLDQPHLVTDAQGGLVAGWVYAGGAPLLRFDAGTPVYYLSDALGSVSALADATGQALALRRYDGFGNLRSESGPAAGVASAAGGDFRFHGEWFEEATGLYHLRAREYDPATGRFLSRDAAEFDLEAPELSHPYVFAGNNPLLFKDPTGLFSISETNVMAAIQSNLGRIQANFARQMVRELVREARSRGIELLINGTIRTLGLDGYLFQAMDLLGFDRAEAGKIFEASLSRAICNVAPDPVYIRMWFEPWMDGNGRPRTDGVSCPELGTFNPATGRPAGVRVSRPDILLLLNPSKYPTELRRGSRGTIFPGDFKLTLKTAVDGWRKKRKKKLQFLAIKAHAVRYGFRLATLWSLINGSPGACKSAQNLFLKKNPKVALVAVTLTGGLCSPVDKKKLR